jgi:hypothetical protein
MPRPKGIDLADMTAEEELRSLRQWAAQQKLFNVSDALGAHTYQNQNWRTPAS